MLANLPFWAQIKNLRTGCRKPHKLASSGRRNIIVSDFKRHDEGLPEYVKKIREIMMIFEVSKLSPDTLFDDGAYLCQFWSYKLDCEWFRKVQCRATRI